MTTPETRYAKAADGVHVAYQVVGDGLVDMVFVMGWVTTIAPRPTRSGRSPLALFGTLADFTVRDPDYQEDPDAGEHDLKGVPDRWRLYLVTA